MHSHNNLSISKVSQIFAHVNTSADEDEEGDDDEAELYSLCSSNVTLLTLLYTLLTCFTYGRYFVYHRPSFASTSSSLSSYAAATPKSLHPRRHSLTVATLTVVTLPLAGALL